MSFERMGSKKRVREREREGRKVWNVSSRTISERKTGKKLLSFDTEIGAVGREKRGDDDSRRIRMCVLFVQLAYPVKRLSSFSEPFSER